MKTDFFDRIDQYIPKNKIFFIGFCIILLFIRRPMEFLHPYVWAEDGVWNIPAYLNAGFLSAFQPVQGYLILPSKFISIISLKLSFVFYPEISMYLSILFSVFCLYLVAFSPTLLKYRVFCALAIICVPSDPEVFVLPLYSFWWGTLLIFLSLFWNQDKQSPMLRLLCTCIGGLSSPIIILCPIFFLLRFYFNRNKSEFVNLFLVVLFACVEAYFVFNNVQTTQVGVEELLNNIPLILNKFIAQYFISHVHLYIGFLIAVSVILFLSYLCIKNARSLGLYFFMLSALIALCTFSSLKRIPLEMIDPYLAGPRYFFFPYVLFSWLLLWLLKEYRNNFFIKSLLVAMLLVGLINSLIKFIRVSESPSWRDQIKQCLMSDTFDIPINLDGKIENYWFLTFSREKCLSLIDQSLIDRHLNVNKISQRNISYKFSGVNDGLHLTSLEKVKGGWEIGKIPSEAPSEKKEKMLSSWINSDVFMGRHRIEFEANFDMTTIFYQTGPVAARQNITISDSLTLRPVLDVALRKADQISALTFKTEIGKKYEILLSDDGDQWGEWSAIYIPDKNK